MKKAILFVSIVSLFLSACQQDKTSIRFENKSVDLGTVDKNAGWVEYTFHYKNVGERTVRLDSAIADKDVYLTGWAPEPVFRDKEGEIMVRINPRNLNDEFQKNVRVVTSDPENPEIMLSVKGTAISKPQDKEYRYRLGNLQFKSYFVNFQQIPHLQKMTDTLYVKNNWDRKLTFEVGEKPEFVTAKVVPNELEPGAKGIITVTMDASKTDRYGNINERLELVTNDVQAPNKNIKFRAMVIEDFSSLTPEELAKAPKIVFNKTKHDFGKIGNNVKVTYDFNFKNEGKQDLVIRNIKSSCGCTAAQLKDKTLSPGESNAIEVTFNSKGRRGRQHKTVTVTTNDPKNPIVRLNIECRIES